MSKKPAEQPTGTQSLDRALSVIFALVEADQPLTVQEIAKRVNIPVSTTYRLVSALEQRGLLERHPHAGIRLGLRVLELSRSVVHRLNRELLQQASPIMEELTRVTGEASVLTGRVGLNAICLYHVDSPRSIRMAFESGRVQPLYRGASNKALLAFLPEQVVSEVLAEAVRQEPGLSEADLAADLAAVRERGYSVTHGELDPDASGIGAPVFDAFGRVTASLSLAGPSDRFAPKVEQFTPLVVKAASTLSVRLGWR